jgi:putative salt-induced outer membrane protein YdiY
MKVIICVLITLVCAGLSARADVVNFKNGDRVSGTLIRVKSGNLELKSEVLGSLTIPLSKVASFSSAKMSVVVVKGEGPAHGQIELEPWGAWQVKGDGKQRIIAASNVDLIMPADSYHTLMEHAARPWQDWKGAGSLGFSIQRGNQQRTIFSATHNAVRERPEAPIYATHWRTNFGLTTVLSHVSQNGTSLASNTISSSLRQDYLLAPTNFVFGLAQLDHVGAQGLYLRKTLGAGFGRDLIRTPRATFSLIGGVNGVQEKFFTGAYNQNTEALSGEKLGLQITRRARLDHHLTFHPNLTSEGRYRLDSTTNLSVRLTSRFSLTSGVIDLYLSNPASGSKKNDIAFTTGLGFTF